VKRIWMVGAILALAALAGPARAQTEVGVQLFGGPGGARLVSEATISAHVQGDLVVTFRGDAAAGCAAHGLCSYSGTIVVHPHDGQLGIVTYRRHGRIGHLVFVSLGSPENGYATSARVTRSVSGVPAGTCADAQSSPLSGPISAPNHGGMVTIRLVAPAGSLLQTRCAGPLDGDLSSASPAVATTPLARLLRGRVVLDLSGSRTFASHGFAGTINSTVTLKLGKPRKQSGNAGFPPGIKTHRVRTVIEQLRLVRVRGGLTATAHGTSNPIVCGLLDSCGLSETLSLGGGVRDASAQVIASGPASRPYGDFLAALGLSRSGRARGIGVFGSVAWVGGVRASTSQAGSICTDTAATGEVGVPFGVGSGSGGFTGSWRTRCPGPSLGNAQPLLAGSLDRAALGRRQFTIEVDGKGMSSDDGYVIVAHGRVSLVLRRGRITQHVTEQPTG